MGAYDTFIVDNISELKEDQELVTVLRDLAAGKKKYKSAYGKIKISMDPHRYPDSLFIRSGQGKRMETAYSMEIIEWINLIPEGM
jgi:hypothetical protein